MTFLSLSLSLAMIDTLGSRQLVVQSSIVDLQVCPNENQSRPICCLEPCFLELHATMLVCQYFGVYVLCWDLSWLIVPFSPMDFSLDPEVLLDACTRGCGKTCQWGHSALWKLPLQVQPWVTIELKAFTIFFPLHLSWFEEWEVWWPGGCSNRSTREKGLDSASWRCSIVVCLLTSMHFNLDPEATRNPAVKDIWRNASQRGHSKAWMFIFFFAWLFQFKSNLDFYCLRESNDWFALLVSASFPHWAQARPAWAKVLQQHMTQLLQARPGLDGQSKLTIPDRVLVILHSSVVKIASHAMQVTPEQCGPRQNKSQQSRLVEQMAKSKKAGKVKSRAAKQLADDDTSCNGPEEDWYHAASHTDELIQYCQDWKGSQWLDCLDLFSFHQGMSKELGHAVSTAIDIRLNECAHDLTSKRGVFLVLALLLALIPGGLLTLAPPCSLYIWLSSSVHRRHVLGPYGNVRNLKVRMSNCIVINTVPRQLLLHVFR